MIRRISCLVAVLFLVSSTSVVFAQGQRGQRGQRPGQGGGFGGGAGVTGLLAMPEVQKELNVTADQKGLIEDLIKDLGAGAGGGGNRQDFQNLSQEERQKRIEELRKQGEERAKKAEDLVKTILDAKQFDRLGQLRLQREGGSALTRDDVAATLNLTSEQKDKIAKIRESARPERGQGGGGGNLRNASPEERQKAAAEARERRDKTNAEYLAVLNGDQKAKWESMLGKKFDFPAPQARRGGGAN